MSNYKPTNGIRVRVNKTYVYDPSLEREYTNNARDWAVKSDGKVSVEGEDVDYSAKAYAIGGVGTETNNAKYYAEQAAASAASFDNYYTKAETDTALSGKQNTLTSTQLNAVNSGVSAIKVAQYDGYATSKANIGLDNLSADGQMIVDTHNGTLSNCILEIPQNIKLMLNNNVLTLKAGSIITKPSDVYTTITTVKDSSTTFSNLHADGLYIAIVSASSGASFQGLIAFNNAKSGTEFPEESPTGNKVFFNIDEKKIYLGTNRAWINWNVAYPLCIIEFKSGVASFAKDSNGNDMIFNGACFIGHHAVVYPGVKGLIPQGFNDDGSLKSVSVTTSSLQIIDMGSGSRSYIMRADGNLFASGAIGLGIYTYIPSTLRESHIYVTTQNLCYRWTSSSTSYQVIKGVYFLEENVTDNVVTDFTIRQPVRVATTEMLDNALGNVEKLLTNI